MSASLVGSEMCIRDRSRRASAVEFAIAVVAARRSGGVCRWSPSAWRPPVSYTHLTLPTICSV
eukprot:13777266-Alexandrium_andersonii.AAC.1